MSKFVGLGKGVKFIVNKIVGKKTSPTITSVKPKVGSLTRRRKDQEDVIQSADKAIKKNKLTKEQGLAVKKTIAPGMKKISKTQDEIDKLQKLRQKKMGGGMMGRRFGYKSGMSVKGDDKRDIRKVEQMTGASKSSKREKGIVPNKFKGFSKLPEKVQQKINAKLAKKV